MGAAGDEFVAKFTADAYKQYPLQASWEKALKPFHLKLQDGCFQMITPLNSCAAANYGHLIAKSAQ